MPYETLATFTMLYLHPSEVAKQKAGMRPILAYVRNLNIGAWASLVALMLIA